MNDSGGTNAYASVLGALTRVITEFSSTDSVIGRDTALFASDDDADSLALDSVDVIDVVTEMERILGIQIPQDIDWGAITTVGDLADLLYGLIRTSK